MFMEFQTKSKNLRRQHEQFKKQQKRKQERLQQVLEGQLPSYRQSTYPIRSGHPKTLRRCWC